MSLDFLKPIVDFMLGGRLSQHTQGVIGLIVAIGLDLLGVLILVFIVTKGDSRDK